MNIIQRIAIENQIVKCAVTSLVNAGMRISVFDGEEYPVKKSNDIEKIMAATASTDEDYLYVWQSQGDTWVKIGMIECVYGNDGYDVISDNSVCLEEYLQEATELAHKLESEE